jgi:hypothetical protein
VSGLRSERAGYRHSMSGEGSVQPAVGTTQSSCPVVTEHILCGWGVNSTTQIRLVPRLDMRGAVHPNPARF